MEEQRTDRNEIQEEVLDPNRVMQAFGVRDWENLGPADSSTAASLGLLVEIKGERYLLRERPENPLGEDYGHRYAFQHYLRDAGIPIPPFRLAPDQQPYVMVDGETFELQGVPQGELFSSMSLRGIQWTAQAAAMLAHLHQASRRYQGPQYRWPAEAHIGAMVQNWLAMARTRAEQTEVYALSSAMQHLVEQWEKMLPSAMVSIGGARNLPEFHIHGDYHPLNLRFSSDDVTAVTGFDASRWEKRIFELAFALFYFSGLSWLPGSSLTRPLVKRGFEPERLRVFLDAYGQIYPPAEGEAALLADALQIITPIATMNGPLEDLFYERPEQEEPIIEDVLERLEWAAALPAWFERIRLSLQEMWA
ncbi:Ser/Thr protein kinase RdoA (MazF antagonist) [Thermosporothrix hazakensis]|jgi:Ser/Thr protein kinase RdoA (MazF antagonist)|uniref:Ser/Thr protein kinase RdoA (MazF antagonist) n=2 Tax=Thermosporothrix TaxID=768650 RepID=A0A326UA11_THEHA|nr:phosphotransferase [Thermosporothrix hazakensis]PZW32043.1 Ser/Thr protein kinase RdoA (MazF antagonist) [Thermosporothrix hazakensis]BBH91484.1 hypothetical protein KTC_62350 [Thermosporothrix sp. COM3]GCE49629.1 hypothetical protein KTH_44980 [Thermosporothrix hazakensis]